MAKKKNYPLNYVKRFSGLREMVDMAAKEAGDKPAFRYRVGDKDVSVSYSEFRLDVLALGTGLSELGVDTEHIAIISENRYDWINVYLAVLCSAGVFVPVDKELPDGDKVHVLLHSDSHVLFFSGAQEKFVRENIERLPDIKYFIGLDLEEDDGDRILSFRALKARGAKLFVNGDGSYLAKTRDKNELKMLVYTSGTTGMAKGVMLSEHNLISSVYYGMQVADVKDSCLSVLPYHHTYEAVPGILVAIHHHATVCINDSLKNVLKNLNYYRPEYIYLVPAFAEVFYKRIWAGARAQKKDKILRFLIGFSNALRKIGIDLRGLLFTSVTSNFGGKLKMIVCGGAPIRPETGKFFDSIGIPLFNGYGITECSPLVSVNREKTNDTSTVGTVLACCEIRFDDVSEDGEGEICVRGDIVMLGYYKDPESTAAAFTEDGFFRTGDYGLMNKNGQLVITGRKKNLIVLTNGKNIFPEEIENYIYSIPYVEDAIVYSIKNASGQETALAAEVYPNADAVKEAGITDVHARLKADIEKVCAELPSYKHISKIYVRDIPFEKTTSNKIKRSSALYNKNDK